MDATRHEAPDEVIIINPATRSKLLNVVLYQTGWFACVLGAAHGRPWTGAAVGLALVTVHVALTPARNKELGLLLVAALVGFMVDSAQVQAGLLRFHSGSLVPWLCPPWIVVMWIQFATLLHFALRGLMGRPWLGAVLGATGGPLAFWTGERLGAVNLHPEVWPSLLALAVVWSLTTPLLLWAASFTGAGSSKGYRRL